jgi:hypothetical protein
MGCARSQPRGARMGADVMKTLRAEERTTDVRRENTTHGVRRAAVHLAVPRSTPPRRIPVISP